MESKCITLFFNNCSGDSFSKLLKRLRPGPCLVISSVFTFLFSIGSTDFQETHGGYRLTVRKEAKCLCYAQYYFL